MKSFLFFSFLLQKAILAFGDSLVIQVPPYETTEEDTYLCTSAKLPEDPRRITAIETVSDQGTVHHILLFGI